MSTHTIASNLRFSHPVTRAPHAVGTHCMIRQFRYTDFDDAMSPLVMVDHFVMTGPTFELHPHAGMSAVTILFEDTQGWMSSHDSVHNDHRIEPGDLHWTLAGRGIVHTQQPEGDGARLNGLQLFVNLPQRLKRIDPMTTRLCASDTPVIEESGKRLRVLAGSLDGRTSPLVTPEPILIVDGHLDDKAQAVLPLPTGWNLWLYARSGQLMVRDVCTQETDLEATRSVGAGEAIAISASAAAAVELRAVSEGVTFMAIAGPSINEPVVQAGPFVMSSREDAEQAMADFQAGKFGIVKPFT